MTSAFMNDDMVVACADLVGRCGATDFELGYLHDDVPVDQAGWYAHAQFRGARITVSDQRSPTGAAFALAERLLHRASCRCGLTVTLSDASAGCRWRLVGARWEPSCDVPSIKVKGRRGDLAAMESAIALNRAARRAADRRKPNG